MFKYKLVEVGYFQDGFKNEYQDKVVQIVKELFDEMGISKDVFRVEICSGHIFDHVRPWMDEAGLRVEVRKDP